MKKTVLLLLTLALLLALTACGDVSGYIESEVQELEDIAGNLFGGNKEEEVWTEEEAEEAFEPFSEEGLDAALGEVDLDEIFEDDEDVFFEEAQPVREATAEPTSEGFEVVTVADNEICTVLITGIHTDTIWGCTVDVYIENHTARDDLSFNIESAYVNGLRCNPPFYIDVEGESAVSEPVYLSDRTVLESGITEFTEIELNFYAYEYGDWSAQELDPMSVTLYPQGEANTERYVREPQESDLAVLETDDISVCITGFEADPGWSYDALVYLENRADYDIEVAIDSVSVNGVEVDDCFFYETVGAGKSAFARMPLYADFFELHGITQLEEMEFMVQVYDAQEYDLVAEEWVTVTAK